MSRFTSETWKSGSGAHEVQQLRAMFDTPFTNINNQGVPGVFGEKENKKIVERLQQINTNADVARSEQHHQC
jgi:hypothetical protein